MKSLSMLLLLSCSSFNVQNYPKMISMLQQCWNEGKVSCIEEHLGKADEVSDFHLAYIQDGSPVLKVYRQNEKIVSMYLWMLDSQTANQRSIKAMLPTSDWRIEALPEKNPHVVNFAEANYSQKLGTSFLTYKLDPEKRVRVLYWGGNYKNIEI